MTWVETALGSAIIGVGVAEAGGGVWLLIAGLKAIPLCLDLEDHAVTYFGLLLCARGV